MASFKSKVLKPRILIVLFLIVCLFPTYKLIKAQTEGEETTSTEVIDSSSASGSDQGASSESSVEPSAEPSEPSAGPEQEAEKTITNPDDASIPEPEQTPEEKVEESSDPVEIDKIIEEVKVEGKKNAIVANLITIAERILKKAYKGKEEITLGDISKKLSPGIEKTDIEKYLDKIAFKKPVLKKFKTDTTRGLRIKGVVLINKAPLNASIEIGKKDNKWYSIFYIKSPATDWELSKYFPGLLKLNKLISGLDKGLLSKFDKSDLFKFGESYFYISTVAMDQYKKFGKIIKGAGFSGKVKFAGMFEILDKVFGLDGKFIEITGTIEPKFIGSIFNIKVPTTKKIIPATIAGKEINLIPGFKVNLTTHKFTITFAKGLPEFKGTGGVSVTLPGETKPVVIKTSVNFAAKHLVLSGRQKEKISSIFGIKDFSADKCSTEISWDLSSKNILPKSLKINGNLQAGKSKLALNLDIASVEDKKVEAKIIASGALFVKDFAKFWLEVIIKDPEITKFVTKLVPDISLGKIDLNALWSEQEKTFILKANDANIKLGEVVRTLMPSISDKKNNAKSDVEKYLDRFAIKKATLDYYKSGLRLRSTILVNNKPVKTSFEIAKNNDKYYSLFFMESPENWKLSEIFPDFLDASKIFPALGKDALKDLFEFGRSYFYISTADIPDYQRSIVQKTEVKEKTLEIAQEKELGDVQAPVGPGEEPIEAVTEEVATEEKTSVNILGQVGSVENKKWEITHQERMLADTESVEISEESTEKEEKAAKNKVTIPIVKGVGFSGKAKFIGAFVLFDKLFGLEGKALEVDGRIRIPEFTGSSFSIKIPTTKTIIPESIKIGGKDVTLVPGFKVDLTPQEFSIVFSKGIPEFKSSGGIKVTVPYEKTPLEFSSSIALEKGELKLPAKKDDSGKPAKEEKPKTYTLLKLTGEQKTKISNFLSIPDFVVDGCKIEIAFDAGSLKPLPKMLKIVGKIETGKSSLKLDALDFSIADDNQVNLSVNAKGSLFVKDYANFWLKTIVKDPKITTAVIKLIPDITLDDVAFNAVWAEKDSDKKLSLKVDKADIKLGDFARVLVPVGGDAVAKLLDGYAIKKTSAEYYKGGIRLEGSILINKKPVDLAFEACKDEKKGWYALFYFKSPEKWRVTDYFPDILNMKAIFPGVDEKLLKPDIFEFSESYVYFSTADIAKHEKVGPVVSGGGFSGKAKFIGFLDIFDKIFALNGEPLEISGDLKLPRFFGSKFSIKIPTHATVFPEVLKLPGLPDLQLIKGFKVDLTPHILAIRVIDSPPFVQLDTTGGILVSLPFMKEKLDLFSRVRFSGIRLKLSGGQRTPFIDFAGIKGLDLDGCELGLVWDFEIASRIGTALAPVTFGTGLAIGRVASLLPVGFIFEGGASTNVIENGKKAVKSKLNIKADCSLHSTKGVDIKYTSKGTLFAKDFVKFWLDVFVKKQDPKATEVFMSLVPPFIFEDVFVDAAWSEEVAEKKFELSVGKFELIPGQWAKMKLMVSDTGISGSGSMAPLSIPDKKNPVIEFTKSLENKKEGPEFAVDCTISPIKLGLKSDAAIMIKSFIPGFKPIESATHIDVSQDGIDIDSKTKILDIDSKLKIVGKLATPINLDSWEIIAGFEEGATQELSKLVKGASEQLLKDNKKIIEEKERFLKTNNTAAQNKAVADIKAGEAKAKTDIDKFFKDSKNAADFAEQQLWREIQYWRRECEGKRQWWDWLRVERAACWILQVSTRDVAIECVKLYKFSGLSDLMSNFAKLGVEAFSKTGQLFVSLDWDIVKNFQKIGLSIAEDFTKITGDILKAVDDIATKVFKIHSLQIEAKVSDIKLGKFPMVEYEATVMGTRKPKRKLQLDIKNPIEFITSISKDAIADITAIISGKINVAETKSAAQIAAEAKGAADLANAKAAEAKSKAGVK